MANIVHVRHAVIYHIKNARRETIGRRDECVKRLSYTREHQIWEAQKG
jgi:hypothetical protein